MESKTKEAAKNQLMHNLRNDLDSIIKLNELFEISKEMVSIAWNGEDGLGGDIVANFCVDVFGVRYRFKALYRYSAKLNGFTRTPDVVKISIEDTENE